MITQSRCKELFEYDPEIGILYWREAGKGRHNDLTAGCITCYGYIQIGIEGKLYLAHRIIWLMMTGAMPCDEIDHIDHDKINNQWSNLREVTRQVNMQNMSRPVDNTSGHIGVNWHHGKWRAVIKAEGSHLHLGRFEDINDAIAARRAAEVKYGFHVNHGTGD